MEIRLKTAEEFRDAHVTIEIRAADQNEAQRVFDGALSESDRIAELEAQVADLLTGNKRASDWSHELEKLISHEVDRGQAKERQIIRLKEELGLARNEANKLRKGHVCTGSCTENSHVAFTGRQRLEELERLLAREVNRAEQAEEGRQADHREIEKLRDKVRGCDEDRKTEKRRADENRDWAERAEARVSERESKLADAEAAVQELSQVIGKINGAVHSPEILIGLRTTWSSAGAKGLANAVRAVREITGAYSPPAPPASGTSQA